MPRKENTVSEIHGKRGTWKIAVRITDMWFVRKAGGKSSVEMVFMDYTGTKIGATLPEELFSDFRHLLHVGHTYVMENFYVDNSIGEWRVSKSDYILNFVKPTCVSEEERPEIPLNVFDFTSFEDIISGEAKPHTLVDIIGVVVDKIEQHTQNPPYRVTVVLRDDKDTEMTLTVWEKHAGDLGAALDKNKIDKVPLIVMLTLAKIKLPTDKYPLSVQNTKIASKLYINADIEEIHNFRKGLDPSKPYYTGDDTQGDLSSQSRLSQGSQVSTVGVFLHNVKVVRLSEIKSQTEDVYCSTVGTVDEILMKDPWSYDCCPFCSTTLDMKDFPATCVNCQRRVNEALPRYKLVIVMEHEGETDKFHFWDTVCIKMFNKTAAQARQQLRDEGVKNMNSVPTCVDELYGKHLALKFKYRHAYRQSSVVNVCDNVEIIEAIKARMPPKPDVPLITYEKNNVVFSESQSQDCWPTPSLSQSAENDPSTSALRTPAKRGTNENIDEDYRYETDTPYQLSSSKHIKSE